jgi:carboxypeptidase PM20D1
MLWLYIVLGVVGLLLIFVLIVLIRTWMFKPAKEAPVDYGKADFDRKKAVSNLQSLVQKKTVSFFDITKEDTKQFDELIASLKELYPHVYEKADYKVLGPRELLFHVKGSNKDDKHAAVFMAHFDVVPAEKANWDVDPFKGEIKDGFLYGRGTIDTKGTFNGVLTAADSLLEQGFVPKEDLYFAFAGDEEVAGGSAKLAVKYFKDKGIEPTLVIDEGGAVVNGIFPGIKKPIACIGTAEKGALAYEFHVKGEGGHASAPIPNGPLTKIAKLAVSIENHPFKFSLTKPVAEMFDTCGRNSSFVYRMIFANLWLFKPILNKMTLKSGGQLNALVRTTVAITEAQGAPVTNVIPDDAMLGINCRLLDPDTVDSVSAHFAKLAGQVGIKASPDSSYAWNPSRTSVTDGEAYKKISEAVKGTWGDLVVTPYIMTACSDSRFYGEISDKVYRFSALHLTNDQLSMIHGDNERTSLKQIGEQVEFFYRLMKSL